MTEREAALEAALVANAAIRVQAEQLASQSSSAITVPCRKHTTEAIELGGDDNVTPLR
jgi:hypothetical protein